MEEHNIPYKRTDIELHKKPYWLKQFSPMETVPVLIINDNQSIHESNVICEYLDEIAPYTLHPKDLIKKAQHRAWIEFGTDILNHIAKIIYQDYLLNDYEKSTQLIKSKLLVLEEALIEHPFFTGDKFHLLDAVYATIFRYFEVIFIGDTLSLKFLFPKIYNWHQALKNRPSVQGAVSENYNVLLRNFIKEHESYLSRQLPS
jgi:glutathione S-transferase